MFEIRRCRSNETRLLMDFIDRYWRVGHVLAASRKMMDWQHAEDGGNLCYLGAWRGGELVGVLGYIPSRRYDPALLPNNILWLALWKVRDDLETAGLGIRLMSALAKIEPSVGLAVNGINLAHPPMYRAMGWQIGELHQFYMVNPDATRQLIVNPGFLPLPSPRPGSATLTELSASDLAALDPARFATAIPRKSPRHFANRFLAHPFYTYRVHIAEADGCGPALLATRIAEHAGNRAVRIVDFMGDVAVLGSLGTAAGKLMQESSAEFADFCQFGIPYAILSAAGFAPLDPKGSIIVPTYFEPFVAKSQNIVCAIKTEAPGPIVICRADGDQDRPNILPEAVAQ